MKQEIILRLTSVILFSTLLLQGCSKSSGSDSNSTGNYLTANVNGKAWSANVNSSLNNSPTIAILTNANGVDILYVIGIRSENKDSSAIAVIFPKNITLNKASAFNAAQYLEGAYISGTASDPGKYYGYNTTPATGGSGTVTVTLLDQSANIVEGTFSGTFGSQQGRPAVQITDGKFHCPYTTDATKLPKSNIKF